MVLALWSKEIRNFGYEPFRVLDLRQVPALVQSHDLRPADAMVVGLDHIERDTDVFTAAQEKRWRRDALRPDTRSRIFHVGDDVLADPGVGLEPVRLAVDGDLDQRDVSGRAAAVVADI